MATICTVSESRSYNGRTCTISEWVDYSVSNSAASATITATLKFSTSGDAGLTYYHSTKHLGSAYFRVNNGTSYYSTKTVSTATQDSLTSAQSITISKTHYQQSIPVYIFGGGVSEYKYSPGTGIVLTPSVDGKTATEYITIGPKTSYTVSYNANGGSGSISNQTKWYGESLTLSNGSAFTRANYKLVKWNTKADGTGTNYSLSQAYTGNAALTLYAIWELNTVPAKIKISNAWKNSIVYIKVNGAWKIPFKGYVKVNGTWKQIKV